MKACKRCKEILPLAEFYPQTQRSEVSDKLWRYYDTLCKSCRKSYGHERRRTIKRMAVDFLGGNCVDCGLVDEVLDVYDFHHLDPKQKDFSFGKRGSRSFDSIKAELSKCVLLCSNCHRKRHAE